MPTVIAVLNQKGGTGKTTTATNLASCLVSVHGKSVLLVDLDPQGSASDWGAARGGDEPAPGQVPVVQMGKALARDLPRVAHSYDYVVIDGTPQISELATAAVKASDVVIIPVQPSPYDIWACEELVSLIKDRQEITDGSPRAAMVVSRAIQGTKLQGEVREALEGYGLPVFKCGTCQRQAYANTVKTGGSVIDLPPNDKARLEIEALTAELLEFAHQ